MVEPLQAALSVLSLAIAATALVQVLLNRPTGWLLLTGLGLLTLGLMVQAAIGVLQVVRDDPDIATWTFLGYLFGVVLLVPVGTLWALSDRKRSGTAVVIVVGLVVPVMILRLQQIWASGG